MTDRERIIFDLQKIIAWLKKNAVKLGDHTAAYSTEDAVSKLRVKPRCRDR